jgi:hypothetical protein
MSRHSTLDARIDTRTPCDSRSLLVTFALAAVVPLALWAMANPATFALAGGALVALSLTARYAVPAAARRLDGRTAAFRLPGLDTQVEVSLAPRPNR